MVCLVVCMSGVFVGVGGFVGRFVCCWCCCRWCCCGRVGVVVLLWQVVHCSTQSEHKAEIILGRKTLGVL